MLPPLSRGHLNDYTAALGQQMFFWGRDVLTQQGNLLLQYGFQKHESAGLKGTSCYRKAWRGGFVELHGACAGWYPQPSESTPGFLFIRTDFRCFAHHETEPVIPGTYDYKKLTSGNLGTLSQSCRNFADLLVDYETWNKRAMGPGHRLECYAMSSKLPAGRTWLRPDIALAWLRGFAEGQNIPRAKEWQRNQPPLRT